ncbi:MAG TPA: type II toxin-antitoxin system RelE/ParE family toxin [Gammaproteobacteria bacterium]|nr:type II toxin-antitoxin system RelE/ParE family toxin [Gammaproteobacteria bacterium]
MVRIVWTPQSLEDIEAICQFIARDAPRYAQLFATRVFNATDRLKIFPESGRKVPEVNQPKIREIIFGNYRIIYRLQEDEVQILTVYHSARSLHPDKIT